LLALLVALGYGLNVVFVTFGFNMFYYIDNLLAVDPSVHPVIAWGGAGALFGACAGLWRAAGQNKVGYLRIIALLVPIVFMMGFCATTKPLRHDGQHSIETPYTVKQRQREANLAAVAQERALRERLRYIIAPNGANVRGGPSTGEAKIDILQYGTEVRIIESNDGWCKVEYRSGKSSKVGFIHESLLGAQRR
ncbi:MAG: SH3 domain-containing protein, partial [Candidatus Krumholzibacteria bacterium]|nr:SH3 domain-containing protein [Candidatus Krumholzibacteria bacterium]